MAIVNVCIGAASELKETELNSASARFAPANVIVPPVADVNIISPVPASQEALVVEFVHVPVTVHVSDPKSIYAVAVDMSTVVTCMPAPPVDVTPEATVPLIVSAPPNSPRAPVARTVPPEVSVIVNVFAQEISRVAIVNVCEVAADEVNVTLLNSVSGRALKAKVIVPPVAESKSMLPVPDSHTVPSVVAFVHVPLTVHASEPKSMADAADEIFTLPVTEAAPDVLVISPPLIVKLPWMVKLAVPFAIVLALSVSPSIVIAAAPDVVSDAETAATPTSIVPVEIVMTPPECVNVPVFWNVNVTMAKVPPNPALL